MIHKKSNKRLRINRTIAFFLAICVTLSAFTVVLDLRLKTVVLNFAKSAVKTVVINCTNKASLKALENLDTDYSMLAKISRNQEGLATSVEIDTATANKIKSYITNEISAVLSEHEQVKFSVPLFAAFGLYYTSLNWPKLHYTTGVTTTVLSNFKSNFQGAGINQVLHQIIMTVTLECDLAVLEGKTEQTTETEFLIAQTVIVGAVPEAFTSVGHATDEVMEDIFDFGATTE
ncbi:MAG: hypothetical protein IIX54_01735 [Clostridia bacterium]|nr:hypothetical protein [Clostridia bacterium]